MNKQNRFILLLLTSVVLVGLGLVITLSNGVFHASTQAITYYVSTTGSDTNPGTSTAPFASVTKARDTIRAAGQKGVTVYIRGGEYDLTAPITFTAADSGTASAPNIYTNYPNETPVFRGSKSLTTSTGDSGQKSYSLSTANFPNINTTHVPELFFNDTRQDMARYPNSFQPNFAATDPFAGYFAHVSGSQPDCANPSVAVGNIIYFDPATINTAGWDLTNYTVQVKLWSAYAAIIRPIASIDQAAGKIYMGTIVNGVYQPLNSVANICAGDSFYLQGAPNLIDKPGEFAYNNTSKALTIDLPKPLVSTDRVSIPMFLGPAISIAAASYIQLHGLEISEVDGDGVFISQSSDIILDSLSVHGVIGNSRGNEQGTPTPSGIEGDAIGAYSSDAITVKNSTLYDAPTNRGISLMSTTARIKNLTKSNDQIINNEVYNVGWKGGIWTDEYAVTIQHNYVHDMSAAGVLGNFTLDDISYNRIENVDTNICDGGAIYTHGLGSFLQARSNKIHDNYIQSGGGYCHSVGSSAYTYNTTTWGIYLDNTASYNQVYNNIVVDAVNCGIENSGWGNSWKNNICIPNLSANGSGLTLNGDMSSYYASAYSTVQNMGANGYNVAAYDAAFPDLKSLPATWDPSYYQHNLDIENNVIVGPLNTGAGWTTGHGAIYFRGLNNSGTTTIKDNIYYDPSTVGATFKGGGFYPFTPAGCVLPYGTPPTSCAYDYKNWDISGWQSHGFDTNAGKPAVANPEFVQASIPTDTSHPFSDNFNLSSTSPAVALGFVNINKSQIGLITQLSNPKSVPLTPSPSLPTSPGPVTVPPIVKLSPTALTACQSREPNIITRSTSLVKQTNTYEQGFADIANATETYYANYHLTISDYDQLSTDIVTKKTVVDAALVVANTDMVNFSCAGNNPKGQLTQFKTDMETAKTALEAYRLSIRNLINAIISGA